MKLPLLPVMKRFWLVGLAAGWLGAAAGETSADPALSPPGKVQVQPKPVFQKVPIFPYGMREAGLQGRVVVSFIVGADGAVYNAFAIASNNPWFERAAIEAVGQWRFEPGRVDGRPVNTRMQVPMVFQIEGQREDHGLWQVEKDQDQSKIPADFRWDEPPQPVATAFAVYPFAALQAGTKAKFIVPFAVDPLGRPVQADLRAAPSPEFAGAAQAMLDMWRFTPATKAGQPCSAGLKLEFNFRPDEHGNAPVSYGARQILRELGKKDPHIVTLDQLDGKLAPISRRPPVYPSELRAQGVTGQATIEFFIDENGDAQLPRIVAADHPEFGYAAAQAVACWRFQSPVRGGKRTAVRVLVPVNFALKDGAPKKPDTPPEPPKAPAS